MRKHVTAGVMFCLLALLNHAALAGQAANDLVYEVYLNGILSDAQPLPPDPPARPASAPADPKYLRDHHERLRAALLKAQGENRKSIRLFWQVASPEVSIPQTAHRVVGDMPDCESGRASLDPEIVEFQAAFQAAAAGLDTIVLGGVPVFSGIVAFAFSKIINHNRYLKDANCSLACAVVPASLSADQMQFKTYFAVEGGSLEERGTGGWDNWSRLDPVELAKQPIKLPNGSAKLNDRAECDARLVCTRVRNWSAHRAVRAKLEVQFDAIPDSSSSTCTDPTMVSRAYRALQVKAMDEKRANFYLDSWIASQKSHIGKP